MKKGTKLLDVFKIVSEGKGMVIIRNPIKKGKKAIEFVEI
jgi:hypothetical protein